MNTDAPIGFVGLGNMGSHMAANLAKAGFPLAVYDAAGTAQRAPAGAFVAASVGEVAARAATVLLSLPDGAVSASVCREIADAESRVSQCVIDTSTIGVQAARAIQQALAADGIEYIDAPVSGGTAGAAAGTISTMFAGSAQSYERLLPLLKAMSKNPFHVGTQAGQGQAMKLANNFLSGLAMAGTSEAICFGLSQGLDMKTMLDVLNVSTGRNTATSDKFPNRILTETYDAGFLNTLYMKDLRLYVEGVRTAEAPKDIGEVCVGVWKRFVEALPGADYTEIYRFIHDQT
jgi:3-hydroxyisobutyrate dehydrogenase-like beta-hydroxyacid dehydrogenase